MRFKFPYQKIMEHKELVKEIREKEFLEAKAEYDNEVNKLEEMQTQVTLAWKRAAQKRQTGGSAGAELSEIDHFLDGQKIRMARQKEVINGARQVMDDKHEVYVEAAREFRIFEKLKEKMKERHKKVLSRLDMKITDEIVVTRGYRRDQDER